MENRSNAIKIFQETPHMSVRLDSKFIAQIKLIKGDEFLIIKNNNNQDEDDEN